MAYPDLSDRELSALLMQGDEPAFAELYRRFSPRIYAHLRRLLKDDQMAQELLQELFVKIWLKREKLSAEIAFRPYVYRIAENLVRDFFRKASRDLKLREQLILAAVTADEIVEVDEFQSEETRRRFEAAVAQLPPQRKKVFTLCKIEGRSYEEVSAMLNISTSTINDHIVKATKAIRSTMQGNQEVVIIALATLIAGQFNSLL